GGAARQDDGARLLQESARSPARRPAAPRRDRGFADGTARALGSAGGATGGRVRPGRSRRAEAKRRRPDGLPARHPDQSSSAKRATGRAGSFFTSRRAKLDSTLATPSSPSRNSCRKRLYAPMPGTATLSW